MNRTDARIIAETITNEQLQQMFETAKQKVKNWYKTSVVNKGMTKGTVWNILAKDFDTSKKYPIIAKQNMIREFGVFLPDELKPVKKPKKVYPNPVHQNPEFLPF